MAWSFEFEADAFLRKLWGHFTARLEDRHECWTTDNTELFMYREYVVNCRFPSGGSFSCLWPRAGFFTSLIVWGFNQINQTRKKFAVAVTFHVCVCVFSSHPFWTSSSLDVPAGVTQEEGHTGILIHLPSAVRALIFVARRIQPFLSHVDSEVEFCVLTN